MHVIVLGAGLLGISSAWHLRQLGHEVTVVDRQNAPAAETSFANGGQISVSHAEPWANPSAPLKVLRWLGQEDAPLLFRLRADPAQWSWGLRFLRECTPARTRHNIAQIVRLGTYSRDTLQQLRRDLGLQYDQRAQGILHFYTSQKEFDAAEAPAAQMRELGCDRRVISADEAVRLEPALRHIRPQLAGATFTSEDESGDARQFTLALAERCRQDGVRFLMGHGITALREAGGRIDHVEATDPEGAFRRLRADAFVVALGSFSPGLLRPLGLRLPIYPAKGYSVTMPVKDAAMAHQVSLTDDEYKLVFSRLGDRLRVEWRKSGELPLSLPMPRLVLQPLLENAVLHGISRLQQGGTIEISVVAGDGGLVLRVRNPSLQPGQDGVHGAGHAQRSIGHRLAYMFGPRARMVSAWREGYYDCEIVLPLDRSRS